MKLKGEICGGDTRREELGKTIWIRKQQQTKRGGQERKKTLAERPGKEVEMKDTYFDIIFCVALRRRSKPPLFG